ncbi:MAG: hypothetical protein IJ173_08990 [Kiritimatiellae bacterium]|nr:hypothetical protein [Kiritimatiellia bacterium]
MKTRLIPILTAALAAGTTFTAFADLEQRDSSQFTHKYEMLKLPTAEDVDGSGAYDFTGINANATWCTLGTGSNTGTVYMAISGGQNLTSSANNGTAGDVWKNLGVTAASGYTIETRLKVTACTGTAGTLLLNASYGVQNHNSWLQFYGDKITWGSNVLTNMDTSAWHTYRLVGTNNAYQVYVDGILVNKNSLGNGFGYNTALNRLLFGGGGSGYDGTAQVAFFRLTKGAYAPLTPDDKSRRKSSSDFRVQYEMSSSDNRISTTGNTDDWTISGASGATISKTNGILSVVPNGKQTFWTTTDSAWKTKVTADTAFTVDFSTKIKTCDIDVDRTLLVWCASPRATGVIMIGTQNVWWQVTSSMGDNILLDSSNNIDGKHVFRITYDGATRHGFTVWRDGVKIGENLVDCTAYNGESWSFVRFGIPGKNNAGAFDIDYIRWDTTGAYDWKDPRKGLQIKIR